MLINKSLAGKKVATEFGTITFNNNGESTDLNKEQTEKLAKLAGFSTPKEEKKDEKKPKVTETEKSPAAAVTKSEPKDDKKDTKKAESKSKKK